jgi:hypothetical protein
MSDPQQGGGALAKMPFVKFVPNFGIAGVFVVQEAGDADAG